MTSNKTCCVPGCVTSSEVKEVLHRFPNPLKDKERFNTWLYAVGGEILRLSNDHIFKYRRICHRHFEERFWCRNNLLSKIAIPTKHIPGERGPGDIQEIWAREGIGQEERRRYRWGKFSRRSGCAAEPGNRNGRGGCARGGDGVRGRCSCQAAWESGAGGEEHGTLCPYTEASSRWEWHRPCPESRNYAGSCGQERRPSQGRRRRLREIRGDWQYAGTTWASIAKEINPESCNCGVSGWEMPYGNFLKNLQRYRLPEDHSCPGCMLPVGVLEDGIHLLARVLPLGQGKNVVSVYNILRDVWGSFCIHQLRAGLKQLSGEAKRGGRFIHRWWRNVTHWDLMYGYTPYKALHELRPEVVDWLVTPKRIGEGLCGEQAYVDLIYQEAVKFLQKEWKLPRDTPALKDWVAAGTCMRGKSGTGGVISVEIEGKRRRTRRYKGVDAVLYSDDQIVREILSPSQELMVVMHKSEGGKIRPVVKTGNEVNRKMDYLSEIVERGLYGSRVSTLFAGAFGNEEIDMGWVREVQDITTLKVPLDQGGFDQHQSKATIQAVLTAIGDVCIAATEPNSDYRKVWESLWHSLIGRRVEIRFGGESMIWGNGIPSGWRWTALLDTMLNYCSLMAIRNVRQRQTGRGIPLGPVCVQGDDVLMTMRDLDDASTLIEGYGEAGYEVHPAKTFFSYERGEFLRRSYEVSGITGYIHTDAICDTV
ncbi:hypothetical protein ACJJTC_018547 [Scirpophaga incertulas]